jgi:hypothetical protein
LHDATKIKLSKAVKNLHKTDLEYRRKYLEAKARQVICIDTGKIYISVAEASRELGIRYDNIHQVCIGNNNCARGNDGHYYQFAYYEKGVEHKLKKIKNLKTPKAVVCVNTGETFNSTREAAQKTGVGQSHISQCCNGKRRFAGRMENGDWIIWEFEENYNPNKEYDFTRDGEKSHRSKRVRCFETGEVFGSQRLAEKKYKIAYGTICMALKKERKYAGKLPDGTKLTWGYAD